jgi:hypothetical protein
MNTIYPLYRIYKHFIDQKLDHTVYVKETYASCIMSDNHVIQY